MKVLRGIPASPGLAMGPALTIRSAPPVDPQEQRQADSQAEILRLEEAITQAGLFLEKLQHTSDGQLAEILAAQREMLDDPELKEQACALIEEGSSAEAAITRVAASYAEQLAQLPDPYLAARSEDVREAGRRIVDALRGTTTTIALTQPAILVARDLSPAELVGLDPQFLLGVVAESGSATGHLAIVAQGLDIPAVVGVAGALEAIHEQAAVIVDGEDGSVTCEPGEKERATTTRRLEQLQEERRTLEIYRDRPGLTADKTWIEVFANIGSLAEAQKAVEMGAEGVGLFRTEFLATQGLPSEETQLKVYTEIASLLRSPLIVRMFDIGGDKPVPGLDIPAEANPFLGWRGVRLGLDRPEEVFLPQMRALLRAAINHDIRIMLPMIATPQEVEVALELMARARRDLEQAGYTLRHVPLGIMVETPAAALTLDQFSDLIDFASIGTNDLVQYTYAVDRTNPRVRERARPLGLATLRLIEQICQSGLPVAVCGQLAADPAAIPLLVGLGVRELSVAPARVSSVKHVLSTMTLTEMQERAQEALGKTRIHR
ncbi:MAG TPA: phosphoenolpyruvate--protein phosphotransferase [Ktedonobacteraceae bacterium]|nr:phosphoenolpyruvate--protein phosphotransferase [Ktedonobacteraceae bacterium]